MKLFTFSQKLADGSPNPEWLAEREKCLLTASEAGPFLVNNDERGRNTRRKRILEWLSRDCYTGGDALLLDIAAKEARALDYNLPILRGNRFESEAVAAFCEWKDMRDGEAVGLIVTDDGLFGASPDHRFADGRALLETKVPLPETHLGYIIEHRDPKCLAERGGMVADYLYQVHMQLAVSEAEVCHFYSHPVPFMDAGGQLRQHPKLHIEVRADGFTEKVRKGLANFKAELEAIRGQLAEFEAGQAA